MPATKAGKLSLTKRLSETFVEPFRSIVQNIPEGSDVKPVYLADYIPQSTSSTAKAKDCGGRIASAGDSAHAMVRYRGEGANHAIVDIGNPVEAIKPLVKTGADDETWMEAIKGYEEEMVERSTQGVLVSRQACLDAHDFERLNDDSPLVRRRLMRADLEKIEQDRGS
jgi:2-polyprenyl-6-methoxyphenol hydroxylase-like FAD-dependent oxidoreductase